MNGHEKSRERFRRRLVGVMVGTGYVIQRDPFLLLLVCGWSRLCVFSQSLGLVILGCHIRSHLSDASIFSLLNSPIQDDCTSLSRLLYVTAIPTPARYPTSTFVSIKSCVQSLAFGFSTHFSKFSLNLVLSFAHEYRIFGAANCLYFSYSSSEIPPGFPHPLIKRQHAVSAEMLINFIFIPSRSRFIIVSRKLSSTVFRRRRSDPQSADFL